MSVEVFAAQRSLSRRSGDLACRASSEDAAWAVMIRVGDRTFTSDCRDRQEAVVIAQSIRAEFERHFGDQRERWG